MYTSQTAVKTCRSSSPLDHAALILMIVYGLPPKQKNKFTTIQLFEEFSTFLQDKVTGSGELLMVGDLNSHLDKKG